MATQAKAIATAHASFLARHHKVTLQNELLREAALGRGTPVEALQKLQSESANSLTEQRGFWEAKNVALQAQLIDCQQRVITPLPHGPQSQKQIVPCINACNYRPTSKHLAFNLKVWKQLPCVSFRRLQHRLNYRRPKKPSSSSTYRSASPLSPSSEPSCNMVDWTHLCRTQGGCYMAQHRPDRLGITIHCHTCSNISLLPQLVKPCTLYANSKV